jgi:hypothetical protein
MENEIKPDPGPAFEGEDSFIRNIHRLYFRPKAYFAGMTAPKKRAWLYLFAFTYSLAYAIDRRDLNSLRGSALPSSWAEHWGILVGAALIGALLVYVFGGWWYRSRLRFCGVEPSDSALVKMVYLGAAQVYALPMIVAAVAESFMYKDPATASILSPTWLGLGLVAFAFWSLFTSYTGVRTVFDPPRRAATAFWFLGGPAALNIIVLAGMFWMGTSGALPGPDADVAHPREFSNADMAFSYPGNWTVTEKKETDEAWAQVQVEPMQDAVIVLGFFEPEASAAEHLEYWSEGLCEEFEDCQKGGALDKWGDLEGLGQVILASMGQRKYEARGFIAMISEDRYLIVSEILMRSQAGQVQPGFDLIRRTFRCLRE